jgi:ABC-type multidrug transport system ATPase subunit
MLSSHDLAEVAALADRIAFFVDGKLRAVGEPGELIDSLGVAAAIPPGTSDLEVLYRAFTAPARRVA